MFPAWAGAANSAFSAIGPDISVATQLGTGERIWGPQRSYRRDQCGRADPGGRRRMSHAPDTWPSSRSRPTNSRRRASIWACKARRSSETACSLLVSSLKRDADSFRASECGSGKPTTRLILLRGTDHGKFNWTQDTASPRCRPRTQCCFHEPRGASLVAGAAQRLLLSLGQRLKQKPQRRGRWAGLAESQSASSGWESLRPR
jgi:hypothetical protein